MVKKKQFDNEILFESLFDLTSDGIALLDLEGTIIAANKACAKIFGKSLKKIKGVHFSTLPFFDLGDDGDFQKILDDLIEDKSVEPFVFRWQRGKRTNLAVEVRVRVIQNGQEIAGFQVISRDITAQHDQQVLLEAMMEHSLQGVIIFQGRKVVYINTACERIFGYSRQELLGYTPKQFTDLVIHPDDRKVLYQQLKDRLAGEDVPASFESRIVRPDGEVRWLENYATIIDYRGRTANHVAVVDITEKKIAEDKYGLAKDFYLTLFEEFPAMIWRSGMDAKRDYFNHAWLAFTGRSMEQELGNGWLEGVHPDDADRCMKIYLSAFEKQESFRMEYRLMHHSGGYRWVLDIGEPYYDIDNNFAGYIGNCLDIQGQKQLMDDLLRTNRLHQALLVGIPDVIFQVNAQNEFINYIPADGFDPLVPEEDILGHKIDQVFPKPVADQFSQAVKNVFAGQGIQTLEYPLANGKEARYFEARILLSSREQALAIVRDITEKTSIEAELRDTEERFRTIFEQGLLGMMIVSLDHDLLQANHAFVDMLGYTEEEFLQKTIAEITHPDDIQNCLDGMDKMVEGEVEEFRIVKRYIQKNGELIWANVTIAYVGRDGSSHTEYFLILVDDITEQRQAGEQMRLQSAALESAANSIVITDVEGGVRWVNPAFTRISGYSFDEAVGQNTSILKSGEHSEEFYQQMWDTILAGETWHGILVNRRQDGSIYHQDAAITPVLDDQGNITNFLAIGSDISEQVEMLNALETSEERYRLLFNSGSDAVFVYWIEEDNKLSNFIEVNDIACERLEYSREELLNMSIMDISVMNEEDMSTFVQLLEEGKVFVRTEYISRDGGHIPVEINSQLFTMENQRAVLSVARDVTERRQSEVALQKITLNLRKRVKELNALYALSNLVESFESSLEEVFVGAVELIPYAFYQPDLVAGRLVVEGNEYPSSNFRPGTDILYSDIEMKDVQIGKLEAHLLEEGRRFTEEEKRLLDALSERLTRVIERVQVEKALEDNEKRYRELIELLQEGVWAVDAEGRTTFINQSMADILGYTIDEIVDSPIFDFMDEQGAKVIRRNIDRRQAGISEQHDFELLHKNGDHIYVTMGTSPIYDDHGNYDGFIAGVMNITTRVVAERALLEQKHLFENLVAIARATAERPSLNETLQNALDVSASLTNAERSSLFIFDDAGNVVLSSLARGLTVPTERRPLVDKVMKGGLAGWVTEHKKLVLIRDTSTDERWITLPDQLYEVGSAMGVPILSGEKLLGVLILHHSQPYNFDENDAQLMQAAGDQMALALRNAQVFDAQLRLAKRQTALYETLQTIGQYLDPDQLIENAVRVVSQVTGWPGSSILLPEVDQEDDSFELVPQTAVETFTVWGDGKSGSNNFELARKCYLEQSTQLLTDDEIDNIYYGADSFIIKELAIPLRRGDRVLGVLYFPALADNSVGRDDIMLAESLADAISLALENAWLFEEFRKTAERLREVDRLKSAFLANMSHEIRTPLNAVIGMTNLLLDSDLTSVQRDYGENIRSSGNILLSLINDILDFSRIEAGKLELDYASVDLWTNLEESVDVFASQAESKGLDLIYHIDKDVPVWILGDGMRLRQVMLNLISNAIKFTMDGHVFVEVTSEKISDMRHRIKFAIKDTGIGLASKNLSKIFEAFYQADDSPSRRYGGTGLGLVISKHLCQLMGGDIWVESQEGVGSVFEFYIEVNQIEGAVKDQYKPDRPGLEAKRALVVHTSLVLGGALKKEMEFWGMEVVVEPTRQKALEMLQDQDFDVVILNTKHSMARILPEFETGGKPLIRLVPISMMSDNEIQAQEHYSIGKPVKFSQLFLVLGYLFGEIAAIDDGAWKKKRYPSLGKDHPLDILIAEDNLINQQVALASLDKIGYQADVVKDGYEVLEAVKGKYYDIILMDVQMPQMDGLTATRKIRAEIPDDQQPYIIALTAHAFNEDRLRCLDAGMNEYLQKPFIIEELVDLLKKVKPGVSLDDLEPADVPASEPQPDSVIDPAAFENLKVMIGENDVEPLLEIIDIYLEATPERLAEMSPAIQEGNAKRVMHLAHDIKSTSKVFGATALADMSAEMEAKGIKEELDGTKELLEKMEAEYEVVLQALNEIREDLAA